MRKQYYEKVKDFYDQLAKRYDQIYSFPHNYNETLCDGLDFLFQQSNVKTILDCACGTGNPIIGLAKKGYTVVGSDISDGMIEQAKKNVLRESVSIIFYKSNFLELEQNIAQKFDCVLCMGNSFSHILPEDFEIALRNMYNILNKGGICYIDTRRWEEIVKCKPRFELMNHIQTNEQDIISFYLYDYGPNFRTYNIHILCLKSAGKLATAITHEEYRIDSYYVFKKDLLRAMKCAGFSNVHKAKIKGARPDLDVYLGYKK